MKIFSIFLLIITLFTGYNNLRASQARTQNSNSGSWLKSWFVSAPTEQQKKIATIVGENATARQKKLADVLYGATLLPEDLIKIIIVYDSKIYAQHRGAITALVVLSHGRLASASADKTIKIWDTEGDRCIKTLEGHNAKVVALTALDNDRLASGADDNEIRIWDIKTKESQTLETGDNNCGNFSWNNNRVTALISLLNKDFASGHTWGNVIIWDQTTGKQIKSFRADGWVTALTSLPNGMIAVATNFRSVPEEIDQTTSSFYNICVFNPTTAQPLQKLEGAHWWNISSLAPCQNGQLISAGNDSTIRLWDLQNRQQLKKFSNIWTIKAYTWNSGPLFVTIIPHNRIISGWNDGKIRVIDLNTMQCIKTLEAQTGAVTAIVALSNGQLASGSDDGTVRIWNTKEEEHKA